MDALDLGEMGYGGNEKGGNHEIGKGENGKGGKEENGKMCKREYVTRAPISNIHILVRREVAPL
jgi:hypothetical protein